MIRRLNEVPAYRKLFGDLFPDVSTGGDITFDMFGLAIAEFEFTLIFADAPIDQFARGHRNALTADQKQGALLFFGQGRCVECHAVSGPANEMFSDFQRHVIGVPQLAPELANIVFDGPGANEDFGTEQITGDSDDRYKFRTSPLRNVALQPAFFHNGAFTRLEDAVRHHLDVSRSARSYDPIAAGVAPDLAGARGPIEPVLAQIDPLLSTPIMLSKAEFKQLLDFLQEGLLDKRAEPERLRKLIPHKVPSGRATLVFEFEGGQDVQPNNN
jgi:cytochrome c peroxidase